MITKDVQNYDYVIVGLGITGLSCVRYLSKQGFRIAITDTRLNPPGLQELSCEFPSVKCSLGKLDQQLLAKTNEVIISPGVAMDTPEIVACIDRGITVIGDVELFARHIDAPVLAITGSNGKSTVTTIVGEMAKRSGVNVKVGGNLGFPVLEMLEDEPAELYVLELSSFQLESLFSLNAKVATILNISPDHMDRYCGLAGYVAAKQHVYLQSEYQLINRDDPLTLVVNEESASNIISFGLSEPRPGQFGIRKTDGQTFLSFGTENLFAVDDMNMPGKHNWANALAALAIGHYAGFSLVVMQEVLREFPGLEHRCQFVTKKNDIAWYNDSKGTNVGATIAAIEGLAETLSGDLILIAGGQGKDADFSALLRPVTQFVKQIILYGQDADDIAKALTGFTDITFVDDLELAVLTANEVGQAGDAILFSPASASFDMFKDFAHRGEVFTALVNKHIK